MSDNARDEGAPAAYAKPSWWRIERARWQLIRLELRRRWPALLGILRDGTVVYNARISAAPSEPLLTIERPHSVVMDTTLTGAQTTTGIEPIDPPWCWSLHRGATCLIAAGHKGGHAGSDLDGTWLRWTDEEADDQGTMPADSFASVPKWVLAQALEEHQRAVCAFCSTGRLGSCRDENYVQILAEAAK